MPGQQVVDAVLGTLRPAVTQAGPAQPVRPGKGRGLRSLVGIHGLGRAELVDGLVQTRAIRQKGHRSDDMRAFERIRQYLRWSTLTGLTPCNERKAPFYQRGCIMPRDLTDNEDELLNLVTHPDQIELVRSPTRVPNRLEKIKQLFQVYAGYSDESYEDQPIRQVRHEPEITPDFERHFLELAEHSLTTPTDERPRTLWGRISRW